MKPVSIIFLIVLFNSSVWAKADELTDIYNKFKNESSEKYHTFRNKANQKYSDWMKETWTEFQALPIIQKPKDEAKPPVIFDNSLNEPINSTPLPIEEVPVPIFEPQPLPTYPIGEVPNPQPAFCKFSFYGLDCKIRFDDSQLFNLSVISNEIVADRWCFLASELYNNTIRDCLEFRLSHNLCDWAYIQFLDKFSSSLLQGSNERNLLTAFLLCQTGYKIRLAKSNDKLYFLYASPHYLYDLPTFKIDNVFYYGYNCAETKLEIFNIPFPNEQLMSFWIPKSQQLGDKLSENRIISSKRYPELKVSVNVNTDLVEFFNTYPTSVIDDNLMTRWAMYANTPISRNIRENIYPQFRKLLGENGQIESVNKILNLIQTGLVYEYDDKVWGHDRAFFAEETLFYPYCDCEDRSILFSRLVRDLLGLDVLLVFYPGHLATAVAFTENVSGDFILYKDKKFVISDPTYIGAPVGMTMPEMNNKIAKVILLDK